MRMMMAVLAERSVGRYLIVGVLNTIVGLGTIYASMYFLSLGDAPANVLGYVVGVLLSFVLNRNWTFAHDGPTSGAFARFVVVTAVAYAANLVTVLVLADGLGINRYLAQAAGIPPYTIIGYAGARWFAFKNCRGE